MLCRAHLAEGRAAAQAGRTSAVQTRHVPERHAECGVGGLPWRHVAARNRGWRLHVLPHGQPASASAANALPLSASFHSVHPLLKRLFLELGNAETRDAGEALSHLRVRTRTNGTRIALVRYDGDGASLESIDGDTFDEVRLEEKTYVRISGSATRVSLLARAREASKKGKVSVHVPITDVRTHVGRVALDLPRRVLRKIGVNTAEAGDRFPDGAYVHVFFDEEPLLREFARAGLAVSRRTGFLFELGPAIEDEATDLVDSFLVEIDRVLRSIVRVENTRRQVPPERAIATMRARGRRCSKRSLVGRARLRRAIGWIDALMPGGENCYRRTLLELGLDAGAANETLVFGLDIGKTGHVAFKGREEASFDVAFEIGGTSDGTRPA